MADELVFAIGASAGGVEALRELLSQLPADFPGIILIVQHTPENGLGTLAELLARRASIPVVLGSDRLVLKGGMAYVAPPGKHMIVSDGRIQLHLGPSINRHRPSIDPMFRSVADTFGNRSVGIILTGYLDDGTAGLIAIKEAGGRVIVQDPEDAAVPSMPLSAMQYVTPDFCLPLSAIAPAMVDLARKPATAASNPPQERSMANEDKTPYYPKAGNGSRSDQQISKGSVPDNNSEVTTPPHSGKIAPFSCPECLGSLWESENHNLLQFTCRVGHTFSVETMFSEQAENVEKALWSAIRVLQEHADLSLRLAERARKGGHELASIRFENRFKESTQEAMMLRDLLTKTDLLQERDSHTAD
jgi:two-component system chemotaxis response regulator CheB